MKSVLLSIKPNWCKLIWSGMKTVELRKTRPKLKPPFKVYIYCTEAESWEMCFPRTGLRQMNGRIIGEFVCRKIDTLVHVGSMGSREPLQLNILTTDGWYKSADKLLQTACMSEATAEKYLKGRNGYGWHISDLEIYDEPVKLKDFWGKRPCKLGGDCQNCLQWYLDRAKCDEIIECISRPPQDWCYAVEKVVLG